MGKPAQQVSQTVKLNSMFGFTALTKVRECSSPHKNAIAKILRHASAQKPAKRLRHKNTKPVAQKPSFLFRFLLAFAHAASAGC